MLFYFAVVLLLIYFWFKDKYSFWDKHGFPSIPGKIPLGSIGEMGFSVHSSDLLKKFYDENKEKAPGLGLYFMTMPVLLLTEPELIKDVLVRQFDSFHDRGFFYNEKDDPLSGHLLMTSGQKWKDLRAKLSPTFTSGKMKMMFGSVLNVSDRMVEFLKPSAKNQEDVEIKEILSSFTTEVISSVAFGLETKCLGNPTNDFRKMANRVFHPSKWESVKFLFMQSFQELSKILGFGFNSRETTDFFMSVIKNSISHRESNNIQRNDFLQLLIQIKNSESGLSMNDIAANSFVFFIAGFETSSSVATFALYELSLNQDIQARLRKENEEILSKYNGEVTYEAIMEMKYLDMVFNETLRKYPVIDSQFRMCHKDYKIPNSTLTIPKGTSIVISTQALHHDDRFFKNPNEFDPERFNSENVKNILPFSYIPFSEGPRICIGSRFGIMQTKLALVKLLQNFTFTPTDKTPIPIKFEPNAAFQSPIGGMWLKVKSIN